MPQGFNQGALRQLEGFTANECSILILNYNFCEVNVVLAANNKFT